jgi:hypothetical protein
VYATLKRQGLTNDLIAGQLNVSESAVRRGLKKAEAAGLYVPGRFPDSMLSDFAQLDQPLRHNISELGGLALTADWHNPLTNYELVSRFLDQSEKLGVRNLAVVGDWFMMDSLSSFDYKQAAASFAREIEFSNRTMEAVGGLFDRIYFTWGNHDARFHKVLQYRMRFSEAMRMLFADLAPTIVDKIVFTNLDHMIVETPGEQPDWYLAHPATYSSQPLAGARKIASKVLMNVATGHSHHTAVGFDVSSRFTVAELGGFFDASKTEYLRRTTTYPNWQNGWGFLDGDGHLRMEAVGWSVGK